METSLEFHDTSIRPKRVASVIVTRFGKMKLEGLQGQRALWGDLVICNTCALGRLSV